MAKRSLILLFIGLFFSTNRIKAADQVENSRPLSIFKDARVEGVFADAVALPLKCDNSGNITTRLVANDTMENFVRISAGGGGATVFSVTGPQIEVDRPRLIDFASLGPEVFALIEDVEHRPMILRYNSDGRFIDKIEIKRIVKPLQLAAFDSGEFLISGKEIPESQQATKSETGPFLGIFGADGNLRKRIELAKDVQTNPASSKHSAPDPAYEMALAASVLVMGDDGFAYLMRRANDGPIFKISGEGEVVASFRIQPPAGARNSGLLAVAHGLLAVEFMQFKPQSTELKSVLLQLIDGFDGKIVLRAGHADPAIGPSLACYDRGEFVFLSAGEDSHFHLIRTTPEK